MKKFIFIIIINLRYFTSPLLAMLPENGIDQERGLFYLSSGPISESQRITFIPDKEEDVEWTKTNIGDSDHDGFIISITKKEAVEPLTVVCLNMMAFTTMKHTYKVKDVRNENDISPSEVQDYKDRLNRIAEKLARRVGCKKNLVFVLQEMRQSNLKNGKFFDDGYNNTEFRDSFVSSLANYSNKKFDIFSKSTATNTFSNLIIIEKGLNVAGMNQDNLPELDLPELEGLKTGALTERVEFIESGHAVPADVMPNDQKPRGIKTQKDRALGVEVNGIEVYGLHLLHHKCDLPPNYAADLYFVLTQIFQRKQIERKPMVLIGDFNFDLENMKVPEIAGLTMGYMRNGALDEKGNKKSIDGYIASSDLIIH